MRVEALKIRNYRALQHVEVDGLPGMCVFLGANGSGKSTLFDIFSFLRDALQTNVSKALAVRGGFKEVVSRNHSEESIGIEVKFREGEHRRTRDASPLITYSIEIGLDVDRSPVVLREILQYRRGQRGRPWQFLNFQSGQGEAITNEQDYGNEAAKERREPQRLDAPDILAIKGLGQFKQFRAAASFRKMIENWHVSDFHIADARSTQDAGYAEHLSRTGENLALVAQFMHQKHPLLFEEVLESMQRRVPGITDVKAMETEDGRIVLKFRDGAFQDPFIARYVSDGTMKMFAYLLLLKDPNPHPLLAVEEPENQLHPELLTELADEFRAYAKRGGQVFVSTHSPDFVNAIELSELFWLEKDPNGYSRVVRARDQDLLVKLVEEGDLPGYLWKQGLFGGAGPRNG